jgi:hypothetical protein
MASTLAGTIVQGCKLFFGILKTSFSLPVSNSNTTTSNASPQSSECSSTGLLISPFTFSLTQSPPLDHPAPALLSP